VTQLLKQQKQKGDLITFQHISIVSVC